MVLPLGRTHVSGLLHEPLLVDGFDDEGSGVEDRSTVFHGQTVTRHGSLYGLLEMVGAVVVASAKRHDTDASPVPLALGHIGTAMDSQDHIRCEHTSMLELDAPSFMFLALESMSSQICFARYVVHLVLPNRKGMS